MLTTEDGRTVQLGDEIGRGGEGIVYAVLRQPDVVAKLYQQAVPGWKADKLRAMVRLRDPAMESFAAWPTSVLKEGGQVRGFLMPRLPAGFKPIHQLYGPKSRQIEFPGARWDFLVHVAMNLCRAFASIYQFGHIVGDVNHDNIRVNANGVVRFIDCDSFQIRDGNRLFRSVAGVALYTAPELQDLNLATFDRTPQHDAFGLAVVLFQILMMGRHPFAGTYLGQGEMPIERAIKEKRFVYGWTAANSLMKQPPFAVGLEVVLSEVRDLFCLAFEAAPRFARPSPTEWLSALERQSAALEPCPVGSYHIHSRLAKGCPWCKIASALGWDPFWPPSTTDHLQVAIVLDELRGRIAAADIPVALPATPDVDSIVVVQDASVRSAISLWLEERRLAAESWAAATHDYQEQLRLFRARKEYGRRGVTALRYIALGAVVAFILLPLESLLSLGQAASGLFYLFCILLYLGIAVLVAVHVEKEPVSPVQIVVSTPPLVDQSRTMLIEAENVFAELLQRRTELARDTGHLSVLKQAKGRMGILEDLPAHRERRKRDMAAQSKERQRTAFLSRHRIQSATIPQIGPERTATLRSYGVETAADVSDRAVRQIPGFGPSLTFCLMEWRRQIEGRFVFDPSKTFTAADEAVLNAEIGQLRQTLVGEVRQALDQAEQMRSAFQGKATALQGELLKAAQALARAKGMLQGL